MMTSQVPWPSNVALHSNLLHAIGHVTAVWAQLEFQIDSAIHRALGRPNAHQIKTTLVQPFDKRLDLLKDLLPLFLPGNEVDKWALTMIADLKSLHGRRNLVVHGAVANSAQERKGETVYWFRRVRWDRPAHIAEKRALTVAQVEKLALEISDQIAVAGLLELWGAP